MKADLVLIEVNPEECKCPRDISACDSVTFDEKNTYFYIRVGDKIRSEDPHGWRIPPEGVIGAVKIGKDWFWVKPQR